MLGGPIEDARSPCAAVRRRGSSTGAGRERRFADVHVLMASWVPRVAWPLGPAPDGCRFATVRVAVLERGNEPTHRWRRTSRKKSVDPDPRRQRRPPVAGEDRDERSEHALRRLLVEEQIAELGRVEAEHESAERAVPLALAPRKAAESAGGQVAGRRGRPKRPAPLRGPTRARSRRRSRRPDRETTRRRPRAPSDRRRRRATRTRSPSRRAPATRARAEPAGARRPACLRDGAVEDGARDRVAWNARNAARGSTTPTLISSSEIGISQNHPRSARATMRMSPRAAAGRRGTPE